jgi:hypothetical protein
MQISVSRLQNPLRQAFMNPNPAVKESRLLPNPQNADAESTRVPPLTVLPKGFIFLLWNNNECSMIVLYRMEASR